MLNLQRQQKFRIVGRHTNTCVIAASHRTVNSNRLCTFVNMPEHNNSKNRQSEPDVNEKKNEKSTNSTISFLLVSDVLLQQADKKHRTNYG